MNNFILLKNELSLIFVRDPDSIKAMMKIAIKLWAHRPPPLPKKEEAPPSKTPVRAGSVTDLNKLVSKDDKDAEKEKDKKEPKKVRKPLLKPHEIEEEELKNFQKILKSQYDIDDEEKPSHQEGIRGFGNVMPKEIYDKLVKKLLEYNKDVNEGMEISYVNYIKKLQ